MYREHFELEHLPFAHRADLSGLFQSPSFEACFEQMLSGVLDGSSVQLLVGEPGTGKTTLLGRLASRLSSSELLVVNVGFTRLTYVELVSYIAGALRIELEGETDDAEEMLRSELIALQQTGIAVVVLIDEAQSLTAPILNDLPSLFAGEPGDPPLAQLVLAVLPDFVQLLTSPDLDALNAALDRISHLERWDRDTVLDYVSAAVQAADGSAESLFTPEALDAIVTYSGGVPQSINSICAASMLVAYQQRQRRITGEMVRAGRANATQWHGEDFIDELIVDPEPELGTDQAPLALGPPGPGARLAPLVERWRRIRVRLRHTWLSFESWLAAVLRSPRFGRPALGAAVVVAIAIPVILALLLWPGRDAPRPDLSAGSPATGIASAASPPAGQFSQFSAAELRELTGHVVELARNIDRVQARLSMFETELKGVRGAVARATAEMAELRTAAASPAPAPVSAAPSAPLPVAAAAPKSVAPKAAAAPQSTASKSVVPSGVARNAAARTQPAAPPSGAAARSGTAPAAATGRVAATGPDTVRVETRPVYEVQRGDTLWRIASRHGMTVSELRERNGLAPNAILRAGQRLVVASEPVRSAPAAAVAASGPTPRVVPMQYYTVRRGDSLSTIGKRFTLAVPDLARWNCLTPTKPIFPGQRLSIAPPRGEPDCERSQG